MQWSEPLKLLVGIQYQMNREGLLILEPFQWHLFIRSCVTFQRHLVIGSYDQLLDGNKQCLIVWAALLPQRSRLFFVIFELYVASYEGNSEDIIYIPKE